MSNLNNIYEWAFKNQTKVILGTLRRSPPRDNTPSDTASDARKGRPKRKYPTPGFVLTRIPGPTRRSPYEICQGGHALLRNGMMSFFVFSGCGKFQAVYVING